MKKNKKIILIALATLVVVTAGFFMTDFIKPRTNTFAIDGSGQGYYNIAEEYSRIINRLYNGQAFSRLTGKARITPHDRNVPFQWPFGGYFAMTVINVEMARAFDNDAKQELRYMNRAINSLRYYRMRRADGFGNTRFGQAIGEDNIDGLATYGFIFWYIGLRDLAAPRHGNAFFDDNIWLAKDFINAYELTGDRRFLYEAIGITNWVNKYGYEREGNLKGGVYWNYGLKDTFEGGFDNQASFNVCSMGPHIVNLLKLYNIVDNPALKAEYLEIAKNIYDAAQKWFMRTNTEHFGLYEDKFLIIQDVNGNRIRQTEDWIDDRGRTRSPHDDGIVAYNTGTMIQAGAAFYEIFMSKAESNPDYSEIAERYLSDAMRSARTASTHFGRWETVHCNVLNRNVQVRNFGRHSWFNALLLEGYLRLHAVVENDNLLETEVRGFIGIFRDSLNFAYRNNRAEDGLVCPNWITGWNDSWYTHDDRNLNSRGSFGDKEQDPRQLLLQSANAWSYAALAIFYG
jgi:hypothetical protein